MRLIDADALITWFDDHYDDDIVTVGYVRGLIKDEPTIEPERKKGMWVPHPEIGWGETWLCSECGEKTTSTVMGAPRYNWCPMCGADMRGTEK